MQQFDGSYQKNRKINNDFTIQHENKWYQLVQQQPATVRRKNKVIVEKMPDSAIKISLKDKYLNFQKLPERPKKIKETKQIAALTIAKHQWKPPLNHPWRKPFIWKGKEIKVVKEIDLERLFAAAKNFFK